MFPLIEISGNARERGQQHGREAKARIARSIATYARLFAYCGIDWQGAQRLGAGYRDLIGDLDHALLAEIEGIAAGSGRNVDEILALNARTEILPPSYPGNPHPEQARIAAANVKSGVPDWGECTSVAVKPAQSTTGTTLLAQNWDWLGAQRAALVLLRVRDAGGMSCLTLTEAGMLAKIGFNRRGFGVCLNILRSSDDGSHPGVPVHVLLRALLARDSVADAVAFASTLSFGASSNVLCADASGDSAALEFSPRGLEVVRGAGAALCHTNHFLAPAAAKHQASLAPSLSTFPRLERITALTSAHSGKFSPADLQRMLRDESDGYLSICRRPDPSLAPEVCIETVASVVMDLGKRVMHIAPDVPSKVEFTPVALGEAVPA
ncbi:MAG: C45 family autoproteolytic acyltransferase/hydrolase [Proteobacteria bacterium]|nr:C45 family autoproteolytic acyltransferase/hydrolase [Pseudomonadota bacterium]